MEVPLNIHYKAIDAKGKLIEADSQGKDRYELMTALKEQGVTVIEMKESEQAPEPPSSSVGLEWFGVSQSTVAFFTRQFSELIDAGIPLTECLISLKRFSPSGKFCNVIDQVLRDIQRGSTLHGALAKHPECFDTLYVTLVEAGEASGNIPEMFARLADYMEQEMDLRSKIRSALAYPTFVLIFSFLLVYGLVAYLLPTFEPMWKGAGLDINKFPVTVFLMDLSALTHSFWDELLVVVALAGVWMGFRTLVRRPGGDRALDAFLMKMPILGNFITLTAMSRVASTLGTMVRSGTSLLKALEMAAGVAGSRGVGDALLEISKEVASGKRISAAFQAREGVFPALVVQMISIGDVSGQLDKMLPRVARYYQSQLESAIKAFSSLIEPITMVMVGGVVFVFVIGVFMPIMGVVGALQQKM